MLAPRTLATHRPSAYSLAELRKLLWRLLCLGLLAVVVVGSPESATQARIRHAAGPFALDVVGWEVRHLAERGERIRQALLLPADGSDELDGLLVRSYLDNTLSRTPALRAEVEATIERGLTAIIARERLAPLLPEQPEGLVFPPVSLALSEPPKLLVISPRDRISVKRSVLIRPTVSETTAERIERQIDGQELVSLVVPTGGLSTYPSMVQESASPRAVLRTAAHEWIHAYLFFTPLGQAYWSNYGARTINETVADMAGRELGDKLAARLGLEPTTFASTRIPAKRGSGFQAEMRTTRHQVDQLLAEGQVEEAEAYMEARRQEFVRQGYPLRKLNQAYFAFFGSYGESGHAGENPVAVQLQQLRQRSPSLASFLTTVGQVRSLAELAATAASSR